MIEQLAIGFGPARLQLLADRAVYWPARQLLLLADLHLGKGDVFRRHGIAVPRGGTGQDLARLAALLAQTGARRLMLLGDVVHGPIHAAHWQQQWRQWRQQHRQIAVQAVRGNHDRALERAAAMGIELLGAGVEEAGLWLCHEPVDDDRPLLCGHLHPVVRLPGLVRALPVFWQQGQRLVLPAFSAFTGGWRVQPGNGAMLVACDGEQLQRL